MRDAFRTWGVVFGTGAQACGRTARHSSLKYKAPSLSSSSGQGRRGPFSVSAHDGKRLFRTIWPENFVFVHAKSDIVCLAVDTIKGLTKPVRIKMRFKIDPVAFVRAAQLRPTRRRTTKLATKTKHSSPPKSWRLRVCRAFGSAHYRAWIIQDSGRTFGGHLVTRGPSSESNGNAQSGPGRVAPCPGAAASAADLY